MPPILLIFHCERIVGRVARVVVEHFVWEAVVLLDRLLFIVSSYSTTSRRLHFRFRLKIRNLRAVAL